MSNQKAIFFELGVGELKEIIKQVIREERQERSPSSPNTSEELITRKEAASYLGVSLPTLSQIVKRGEIPAYRLGGKIMFRQSELVNSLRPVQCQKFRRSAP